MALIRPFSSTENFTLTISSFPSNRRPIGYIGLAAKRMRGGVSKSDLLQLFIGPGAIATSPSIGLLNASTGRRVDVQEASKATEAKLSSSLGSGILLQVVDRICKCGLRWS
jgi:hypothetical protein